MQVLYDGAPDENVYIVTVQVANDSATDLTDLEFQAGLRDGATFLSSTAQVRGSLRALPLSEDYQEDMAGLLSAPPAQRAGEWRNRVFTKSVLYCTRS